jgi:tetratricopeptide (TPR) repeat protein
MARDPYDLCPCGSGNKLKFCCADVAADMERVERLLGNNQPHMAIQAMEKLREAHPENQWVAICLASTLINDERPADAKAVLKPILKQHPEQPFANVLYALASFNADGYPTCKRAAHRAFKQSTQAFGDLVGTLANAVAESMLSEGKVMAARQYLVIALRLCNEAHRRLLFEDLMELDGDTTTPYPLRGVRHPLEFDSSGDAEKPARLAARLATVGCFDEAADMLQTIADAHPDDPNVWYNIGLFRVWDGDHPAAVDAFRKAAGLFENHEQAVECELLAQCLELGDSSRGTPLRLRRFNLKSVAQMLSRLDEADRFARVDRDQQTTSRDASAPEARYVFLSRALEPEESYREWTWQSVPLIEGRITVFDADTQGEQPAQAFLVGLEGEELDRATEAFEQVVGELVEAVQPEADADAGPDSDITGFIPEFEVPLRWSGFVPPQAPGEVARQTARQRWEAVVEEIWPNQPHPALGDRSPLQAAGDESVRVALEASLMLFDAYADARNYMLPLDRLRERLSLPAIEPLTIDERIHLNSLSTVQVHRLNVAELTSEQFSQLLKRATVLRHSRLMYDVLSEALQRPDQSSDPESRDRILVTLAGLASGSLQQEQTLQWIEQGRAAASERPNAFEALLEWKMRELTLLIESPDDPRLPPLLEDLWHRYGSKLPQLREYLVTIVEAAGVKPPWEAAILTPGSGGESWSQAAPAGGEKKLWLPGSGN